MSPCLYTTDSKSFDSSEQGDREIREVDRRLSGFTQ